MGAFAFLKSVDFRAFAVNEKTIALGKYLYQFGHAIWWSREPSVVDTFLDAYDFDGKTIIPFCTSGGSGIGEAAKRMQEIVGSSTVVKEGKRLGGTVSEADCQHCHRVWIHTSVRCASGLV